LCLLCREPKITELLKQAIIRLKAVSSSE
jgi:hypothetical protein